MDNATRLGTEKVSKLLLEFSIPAIVGMLVSALYNVIDRIFIGNSVGPMGIAGITIGFPIMVIQMAFGGLIGIGATSLISIRLGQNNQKEAERIIGNAIVMLGILTIMLTVASLVFLDPLLRAFGASQQVLPYAEEYMSIILAGSIFAATGFGMNNFIRAEGKPGVAMATMLVSVLVNLVLAPLFIFVFGWGMKGAALATVLAQIVSAVWIVGYFVSGKSALKIHRHNLKLDRAVILGILAIGIAPFMMQVAQSVVTVILNMRLRQYGGDVAISGMGIINSLVTLIVMPVIGISQGSQPIIGYNFGAEQPQRVKEAMKQASLWASIVCIAGFLMIQLFPVQLVTFFNSDKQLVEFGSHALTIYLLMLPIVGFQIIGAGYFQAVGKAWQSMLLNLSRQVLILIPALIFLPRIFNMDGVLYAGPLSDFLAAVLTAWFLLVDLKGYARFVFKRS